jgi:hypothetical protein
VTTETRSAFARRIGIHKSNVTRAAQEGRIVLTDDGLVDVEASLVRYAATKGGRSDVAARHAEKRGAAIPEAQVVAENRTADRFGATANATAGEKSAQPLPEAGGDLPGGTGRARYKALNLHYENSLIKLEMALRRGLRYPLEAAGREAHGLGAMLRAGIERVIDQTAPRLAVMTNELARRAMIDAELRRLRWMIKSELPRALRRMRKAGMGAEK